MTLAQKYLEIVRRRGEAGVELRKVYKIIRCRELYLMAYANLYANTGALTPGTDPNDTVDGMSLGRIEAIIRHLEHGTYTWKPVRRTYRTKKASQKKRALGMPAWSNKLVEEVLRLVLEAYYEPQFRDSSHGFRPGRGCHTALSAIYKKWQGTKWFIEGDIKGCFDTIDHGKLLEIIRRQIKDERVLKLIRGMLQAGYIENWTYHKTYSGTPQGSVLSPLLSNLMLNELDEFMEDVLIPEYSRGNKRKVNPEYEKWKRQAKKSNAQGDRAQYQHAIRMKRQLPSVLIDDPNYSRLHYIRYADDFLLGYTGSREETEQIKSRIQTFLETLGLEMSPEKTLITHARTQNARFLNYHISVNWQNAKLSVVKGTKRRTVNGGIVLRVPPDVISHWAGKVKKADTIRHRPELTHCSDYDIINTYESQLQGLINYYGMAHNVSTLYRLRYWYQQSLVKTLANKHKSSARRIQQKYTMYTAEGRKIIAIQIPRKGKKPITASFGKKPIRRNRNVMLKDEMVSLYTTGTELVKRLLANECELCGDSTNTNVHHIRKLKDLKRRYRGKKEPPEWVKRMIAIRRKTLVVCERCHQQIHNGTYDGAKLA